MAEEIKCTKCGSSNHIKAGWNWRHGKKDAQRRRCKDCGRIFIASGKASQEESMNG
jgi:transposase-like protein